MPGLSTQAVFLPYICAGEGLLLRLTRATVDGMPVETGWSHETATVDLSRLPADWKDALLTFGVELAPEAPRQSELIPVEEASQPPLSLVASLNCAGTYRRWQAVGTWGEAGATIDLRLTHADVVEAVDLRAFLVRTRSQTTDTLLGSDKGSRLAWSREWRIHITPTQRRGGPGLATTWEDFRTSESAWRRQHSRLLFHLDTTPEEPVLFLNRAIDPDLVAVLEEQAPRGRKASIRDVLFAGIGMSVWSSLMSEVRHTLRQALPSEGLPEAGWRRNVLREIAVALRPEAEEDDAMLDLVRDLMDPNGGKGVDERVATAILGITRFRDYAEVLVRESS